MNARFCTYIRRYDSCFMLRPNVELSILPTMFILLFQFQHAMAQAASQLQQIQKKHAAAQQQQQQQLSKNLRLTSPSGGAPSSSGEAGKNSPQPRSQPTKAQLTMPAALQQAKFNSGGQGQNSKSPMGIRGANNGGAPPSPFSVCQFGVR